MRPTTPYSAAELIPLITERCENPEFQMVSGVGDVSGTAAEMAELTRAEQELLLDWIARVLSVHEELAYQFALRAPRALQMMGEEGMGGWLLKIIDVYDKRGIHPTYALLRNMEQYAERFRLGLHELELGEVRGVLDGVLGGLSGRDLRIGVADGELPWTDTDTLYLPASISAFASEEENFRLYKAMLAHHWAQVRFGTFRCDLSEAVARYADPQRALGALAALERLRLDACIARELPGLARDMRTLCCEHQGAWAALAEALAGASVRAERSLELLEEAYRLTPQERVHYQGELRLDKVADVRAKRLAQEQKQLKRLLVDLADELERGRPASERGEGEPERREFRVETDEESLEVRLFLNEAPVAPPQEVEGVLGSILLDLGEIPDEYLHAAGEGHYDRERTGEVNAADAKPAEAGGVQHLYPEWDYRRQHYRKAWCTLRELPVKPQEGDFVERTREKYLPLIKQLRRSFEALRGQEKRLRRQPFGDDIDLDALVEAHADAISGMEMSEGLFTRIHRVERDIAVVFMVDMSGSTKGWINEAEREALILLCEALETLGDRYAIYGFSGMTRTRCEVYPVKRIDEPYNGEVRARIAAMEPRDYTRMGAAIRHLTSVLANVEARTRLLVTLSDGKPDDFDNYYRGEYGIEDTRRALIEAKRSGIHPFCITIDKEGPEYLPHMYGPVNYAVIDEVRRLPLKVADIYRGLTS